MLDYYEKCLASLDAKVVETYSNFFMLLLGGVVVWILERMVRGSKPRVTTINMG